jgi:hypothetical protein
MRNPVEGTMLTVIREMADAAEEPGARALGPCDVLARVLARGEESLARTPELLPVLRDAGVVDAGAAGLVEIVRGVALGLSGQPLPTGTSSSGTLALDLAHHEPSRYTYCTVYAIEGTDLDLEMLEGSLGPLGDSLLVVGDASALRVHLHTDDPDAALAIGAAHGDVSGVEIADMRRQAIERARRLSERAGAATARSALVVVAPSPGLRRLFESYGASHVVTGGATMSPSTAELLAAVDEAGAPEVILLPNDPNVVLVAEHAAGLASCPVRVVPARSLPAGLAASVRFLPTESAERNEATMLAALAEVSTGELARASRDAVLDGVVTCAGSWLGLVDGKAVACDPDFDTVAGIVAERVLGRTCDVLTLLTGVEGPDLGQLLRSLAVRHPGVEVEVHDGGQPHYPLLLLAE